MDKEIEKILKEFDSIEEAAREILRLRRILKSAAEILNWR